MITETYDEVGKVDASVYAIPIYIFFILLEVVLSVRRNYNLYHIKDSFASLSMGIGSVFIGFFTKTLYIFLFIFIYQYRIFEFQHSWITFGVLFFIDDFIFYWYHRLSHEIRILWAAHMHHHSSEFFNFTVALRQSWGAPFYKFIFWAWLPFLGFSPVSIFLVNSISLIYQFFLHTEIIKNMGWVEFLFNTPSHHRVHHASQFKYLDKNHGGVLIIWDKIFGTFEKEDENDYPKYGITVPVNTYNPFKIVLHEFKNIWFDLKETSNWKYQLKYVFYKPGWRHDGNDVEPKLLQKEMKKKNKNIKFNLDEN